MTYIESFVDPTRDEYNENQQNTLIRNIEPL